MRILCADDDDTWTSILARQLPAWGFEPTFAGDGNEAREVLFGEDPPALALLDWMMPGASGVELCREIREAGGERYTYVILMTARQAKTDLVHGLAAGADDYLTKPVNFAELHRRLVAGRRIVELTASLEQSRDELRREMGERNRTEHELREAQKLEAMGMLAAGIAHEINTPVQFIGDSVSFISECLDAYAELTTAFRELRDAAAESGSYAELVAKIDEVADEVDIEFVEEESGAAIARTRDGVKRVAGIVAAMRSFARGKQAEKTMGDINRAISDTLIVAKNEYKYVANVHTDLGELPATYCHLGDLSQVFLNMLVNAAHACQEANERNNRAMGDIYLTTRYTADEDTIAIEFRDTGSGIPDEIIERVFEPFFTTKQAGKGTGQGLALSRVIICEKHDGRLEVDSTVGLGTTFRITLPCVRELREAA